MRIYQLEGFYYVGTTGGYAAAARAIPYPVGQPAIFQQVRKLEDDLDVPLVRRDGKRIHLTPEGRLLHDFIAPYFQGLSTLDRVLRSGRGGSVVIAATDVFTHDLLPGRLKRLRATLPDVAVSVREIKSSEGVLEAVDAGTADFGISHFPRLPSRFHQGQAGWVQVVAMLPRRHALAGRRHLSLEEMSRQPLIAYERGSFARGVMDSVFEKNGLKPRVVVEASTSELQIRYVREGLGVALVPRVVKSVSREPDLVRIPMPEAFPSYRIQIAWKGPSSSILEKVRNLLVKDG